MVEAKLGHRRRATRRQPTRRAHVPLYSSHRRQTPRILRPACRCTSRFTTCGDPSFAATDTSTYSFVTLGFSAYVICSDLDRQDLLTRPCLARFNLDKPADISRLDADILLPVFPRITRGELTVILYRRSRTHHPPASMSPIFEPASCCGFHTTTSLRFVALTSIAPLGQTTSYLPPASSYTESVNLFTSTPARASNLGAARASSVASVLS